MYMASFRAHTGWYGGGEDYDPYTEQESSEKSYIGTIDLTEEIFPGGFVNSYEWRDWFRRTDVKATIYTYGGGCFTVELPDYFATVDQIAADSSES